MTVSGLTMTKADRQSLQTSDSHDQRSRSADVSFRPLHGATEHADLMPKREVLQLEYGSRFEGRRRSGGQHLERTERQMEEWTEESQTPCSHSVRHLR